MHFSSTGSRSCVGAQSGVATILVLSLLAGLALMVTAMVRSSSLDIRLLSAQRQQLQAGALLEGAAQLLMRDYLAGQLATSGNGNSVASVNRLEFAGHQLEGSVYPVEALIDLRSAPAEIITQLFVRVGALAPARAARLAQAVVQYRDSRQAERFNGATAFARVSDLMAVPGMPRELYDRVAFALRVSGTLSPGLNLSLLPSPFRQMMQPDAGLAQPPQGEGSAVAGIAGGSSMQLTVSYRPAPDTRITQHFRMSTDDSEGGLPWRVQQRFPLQVDHAVTAGEGVR
jgi:hypothetical protein